MSKKKASSSGHQLGQIIGDWYEKNVAAVLFQSIADELGLYLDHRFKNRSCRSNKIIWADLDGNKVDYDFVLELGGDDTKQGVPLAFFETFWRRGSRHSKDKARDDSGKLMPMRDTYPTARVLGIVSAGDFTKPAQEYVQSRRIDLFFIPKDNILQAWAKSGITIDYPDGAQEKDKLEIVTQAQQKLKEANKEQEIANHLKETCGAAVFTAFKNRLKAQLSAVPINYGITNVYQEQKIVFSNHQEVEDYLTQFSHEQSLDLSSMKHQIIYEATYSDGTFERSNLNLQEALQLHEEVGFVTKYFEKILETQS